MHSVCPSLSQSAHLAIFRFLPSTWSNLLNSLFHLLWQWLQPGSSVTVLTLHYTPFYSAIVLLLPLTSLPIIVSSSLFLLSVFDCSLLGFPPLAFAFWLVLDAVLHFLFVLCRFPSLQLEPSPILAPYHSTFSVSLITAPLTGTSHSCARVVWA